jgi:hypothetical protein
LASNGLQLARGEWFEIIGVVGDAKVESIRKDWGPTLYLRHKNRLALSLAVRYRGPRRALITWALRAFETAAGRLPYTQNPKGIAARAPFNRGSLQSLLELRPSVPQLDSSIEDEPLGLR